jgi:hypothetical protein
MPKGKCALQSASVVADDNGIIHFDITLMQGGVKTVPVVCQAAGGTPVAYTLEVTGSSDVAAIAATRAAMAPLALSKPGVLRPPLTGDPMSYSLGDLTAQGYGLRPDPMKHPARYAKWLQGVRQPTTLIANSFVEDSASNGTNLNKHWNDNPGGWSGAVDYNPGAGANFNMAYADFHVPQVFAEGGFANYSTASTWAGIGYSLLWQTGVQEYTSTGIGFQIAGYTPWWQLAPNTHQNDINNFHVNNGDEIYAAAFICNPSSFELTVPSDPNAYLCAELDNLTQNESWLWASNYNTKTNGWTTGYWSTGDVIQEWNYGGQYDYAQFNPFSFTLDGVYSTAGNYADWMGCVGYDPYATAMWQIGTSSHPIGESCLADIHGTSCNDNPYTGGCYLWVWWDQHNN